MDSALTVSTRTTLTASAASDGIGVQGYELLIDGASVAEAPADSLQNGRVEFKDVPVDVGSHAVKIRANLLPYLETEDKTVIVGS
jgi:hypothetical protein